MGGKKFDLIFSFIVIIYILFPFVVDIKGQSYLKLRFFFGTGGYSLARSCCLQTSRQTVSNFRILAGTASVAIPAGNYMFKVNNRNTGTRCEICSELTIKTPERRWCFDGVQVSNTGVALVSLLKKFWWWLDHHFWYPFSYWSLSFSQLLILGLEGGCSVQSGSRKIFFLIKSISKTTPIVIPYFHSLPKALPLSLVLFLLQRYWSFKSCCTPLVIVMNYRLIMIEFHVDNLQLILFPDSSLTLKSSHCVKQCSICAIQVKKY